MDRIIIDKDAPIVKLLEVGKAFAKLAEDLGIPISMLEFIFMYRNKPFSIFNAGLALYEAMSDTKIERSGNTLAFVMDVSYHEVDMTTVINPMDFDIETYLESISPVFQDTSTNGKFAGAPVRAFNVVSSLYMNMRFVTDTVLELDSQDSILGAVHKVSINDMLKAFRDQPDVDFVDEATAKAKITSKEAELLDWNGTIAVIRSIPARMADRKEPLSPSHDTLAMMNKIYASRLENTELQSLKYVASVPGDIQDLIKYINLVGKPGESIVLASLENKVAYKLGEVMACCKDAVAVKVTDLRRVEEIMQNEKLLDQNKGYFTEHK